MATTKWEFWALTRPDSEKVEWLAATKPGARSALDRRKVWTLVPERGVFLANWFVTQDRHQKDQHIWLHENVEVEEAREIALNLSNPTPDEVSRIARPEAELTLDQLDRFPVEQLLGKRVAASLRSR